MARQNTRGRRAVTRTINQLKFQQVQNPYEPVKVLPDEAIDLIHHRSLDLLETFGIDFLLPEARALLASEGAMVDADSARVRFDRDVLMALVARAPRQFTMQSRNRAHDLVVGGNYIGFFMTASAPNVSDMDRGRRPGTFDSFKDLMRLTQAINVCHGAQGYPVEPIDLPVNIRHLEAGRAMIRLSDKIMSTYNIGRTRLADTHEMGRIALGMTAEEFAETPAMMSMCNCNSPLRYDTHLTAGLIDNACKMQPVVISPFTLAGAMSPITLAGTLVQQNAEALAGVALAQSARAGAPIVYGAFASNVDMKTGSPAFGTPEYAKTTLACAQLARFYGLPYRSSASSTSNAADVQGAYETSMAMWPCVMGHTNFIRHAFGWQEGGLSTDFEKIIMDVELVQNLVEFLRPIDMSEEELGLDAIRDVGPGGHFFGHQHTIDRYENAFYSPILSDWRTFENWERDGSPDTLVRANRIWKQLLADYEEPPIDPAVAEELDAFVERRMREGGAAFGE